MEGRALLEALLGLDLGTLATLVLPRPGQALALAPVFLLYGAAMAGLAAHLRVGRGVRTPYTRKVFHFGIFTGAGLVQIAWGLPGVVLYGTVVSAMVLFAVARGDGFPFYEAMARDTDRPRRSLFIVVPMITTAVGGLASNVLVGGFASVGYLACGWGDAVGEPIGARWGRHRYRVPSLGGVKAERSLEGSAGVLLVGSVASALALAGLGFSPGTAAAVGALCGAGGALVEAFSNHGLDNFTIQVAASLLAWTVLG